MQKIYIIDSEDACKRLDLFLSIQMPEYSRSYFKTLIDEKHVLVNETVAIKAGLILKVDDKITINFPAARTFTEHHGTQVCSDSGIEILFEHSDFAIIYKPAGIVTHHVNKRSTEFSLVDWLTSQFSHIKDVGYSDRPGIVHRLDKDTSGIMVVVLNNAGHKNIGKLFHDRLIRKTYHALVQGHTEKSGTINSPIGRHATVRNKMAIVQSGREALSEYEVVTYYENHTLLKFSPKTGRTHQIRIHCASIKHPLEGDVLYGIPSKIIKRHALHASALEFEYDGKTYKFEKEFPDDFKKMLANLKSIN
jgi:23S rRNA pseudouridine1911/1915/1917 synthase